MLILKISGLGKKNLQLLGTFLRMTANRPSIKVWSGIGSNCTRWTFYKILILWGLAWLPWFDDIAFSSLHVFRYLQNVFFNNFEVNTLLDHFSSASGELAFLQNINGNITTSFRQYSLYILDYMFNTIKPIYKLWECSLRVRARISSKQEVLGAVRSKSAPSR